MIYCLQINCYSLLFNIITWLLGLKSATSNLIITSILFDQKAAVYFFVINRSQLLVGSFHIIFWRNLESASKVKGREITMCFTDFVQEHLNK